jgi:diguanylate cyclase (GGDEF)-like protein
VSVQLRPRNVIRAFNVLTFVAAALAVALRLPHDLELARHDIRILVGVAIVLVAIAVRYSVPLRGMRSKRIQTVEDSVSLDLPITLSLFIVGGGVAAAIACLIGFPLSRLLRRRADWLALAFGGGSRAIFFLVGDAFRSHIPSSAFDYTPQAFVGFIGLMTLGLLAFIYLWHLPTTAWRERIPIERLWRRYLRDPHLWGLLSIQAVWAYACCEFMLRAGPLYGLIAWLPLPTLAIIARSLYLARAENARLRMTRDAITAMLVERDPVPQINSVVAASLSGSSRETIQVVAAIGRDAEWHVVTSIGPPRDAEFDALRAAAVRRLTGRRGGWLASEDGSRSVVAVGAYDEAGHLIGAICALRYARDGRIGRPEKLVQTARELAPLLSDLGNIQRAQEAAEIDGLTQLANRSTILDYVRATLEGEPAEPGALLLLDIDNFKSINDRLGHLAGDRCLRTVGEIVARNVRDGDRAGRFGGEEFLVVMPRATREMAMAVGERLRAGIEGCGLFHADGTPVTCSVGVATLEVGESLESALARADRALYAAKRRGRNMVVELTA